MILEVLDKRKQKVLQIIVEDYINSAEPVGSKTVVNRHHIDASPATIRFDMADLEKHGFIQKPHTSSGRIPSDKGYRFFIDNIMESKELSNKEIYKIKDELNKIKGKNDELMAETAEILSALCGTASIIVSSDNSRHIYVRGISRMLKQPEFNLIDKCWEVIESLEKQSQLLDTLSEYLEDGKTSIHVGIENIQKSLKGCSVTATPFGERGILTIIGPTRMDYEKNVSILDYVSELLTDLYL